MSPKFAEYLRRYADLLVQHGLNVQRDQRVNIACEASHRDLAILVAEAAYRRGARHVDLEIVDRRLARVRVLESSEENLTFVPGHVSLKAKEIVDSLGATLRLVGNDDPDLLADLDPKKLNDVRVAEYRARKYFYDHGIDKSQVHWCVAAAATPGWAKKVFPDLVPAAAESRLWEEIFRATRVDSQDYLELWREHNELLQARARALNEREIKELRFEGPGTDLAVELSPRAIFRGGSETSARGVPFEANLPTEEVFTTPDCRKTRGRVRATRPFYINGRLVDGLELEFRDGMIHAFEAVEGQEMFREYIDSDSGARRLGEVALVGTDSPIYQSGLVFQEILFDENAACHIAIGSAYKTCLDGGETLSPVELRDVGCNESSVHTDMMISSEQVSVTATTRNGRTMALLERGKWVL